MTPSPGRSVAEFRADLERIAVEAGGFLRCETCRRQSSVSSEYFTVGWPKCCGYTMRWWTARQVRDGEVPA